MAGSGSGDPIAMKVAYEDVQAHYDLSNTFFGLFQDPSRTYSCAYFEREDMSLDEAQLAKVDLALGKLDLQPGMTLLDIGCGWAAMMKRAVERYDVNAIGLTLSRNQHSYGQELLDTLDTTRDREVMLRGWEEFDQPVDRIVSIEAFEAFPKERYVPFFQLCHRILPEGGRMVLQTILGHPVGRWPKGISVTISDLKFMQFIAKEIFPGGSVPGDSDIFECAESVGFKVELRDELTPHYVRTLDIWADRLEAAHDAAIEATSQEVYDRYMKYLTGCSDFFNRKLTRVAQFTLVK